ncbi:hypothetical protein C4K03_1214 [Pseudomonas synxantha]|uniref:Uncharacterized protein n=1 Tax=Pseudomonas synxantha TaxID=47883 RepID=A0A3G7U1Y8_9PSED|nr:hypothetical protein C4K03_1214 [Pseudomonas synxantha]
MAVFVSNCKGWVLLNVSGYQRWPWRVDFQLLGSCAAIAAK